MMRWLVLVAGVLALPVQARAEAPKAEARQHVDRATQLHKDGKLADALDELKTAFALDPQPQLLFAMGQIHVQLGNCPQAITYYERFLETKPAAEIAAVTNEAIETCKTNPPPAIDQAKPAEPVAVPPPEQPRVLPTPAPTVDAASPWYSDYVGDGLVAAGLVSGVVGVLFYHGAVSVRGQADAASSYQAFASLVDSAHSKQTEALVFGVASAVLDAAGGVHLVLHHRHDVAIVPGSGGGAVVWTGKF